MYHRAAALRDCARDVIAVGAGSLTNTAAAAVTLPASFASPALLASLVSLAVLAVAGLAQAAAESAPRPHIVVFLADDMGWNDVGYQGSEVRTPHIDRLAAEGVRLTQFYVQPVCTQTRAALLTGRYPMRYGLQVGVIRPWQSYGLPIEERTLANALQEAGYRTAALGKWHLGHAREEYLPLARGFDRHYGHYTGFIGYFSHRRAGGLDWHRNGIPLEEEGYTTDLIAREAVRVIEQHDPEQPLFLYVAFGAAHAPLQAPDEYIERHAEIKEKRRRLFAATVSALDDAVGRVVVALGERGLRSNTLILFASDNGGGTKGGGSNVPLRGGKATLYEGGVRVPALVVWPGRLPAAARVDAPLHVVDWYPTLLRLAGATLEQVLPVDGIDIWRTLVTSKPPARAEILLNVEPDRGAIRRGDWKLIAVTPRGKQGESEERVRLFNLADDPSEQTDLAERHPETVAELRSLLARYRNEAVTPLAAGSGSRPVPLDAPAVWGPPGQRPGVSRPSPSGPSGRVSASGD